MPLSPRALSAPSVGPIGPVAVSCPVEPTVPQALTAADRLLQLASLLRFGAAGLFLEVHQIQRRRPLEVATGRDTDVARLALALDEAAQEFTRQAHDAELQAYLAHRAAGGMVILKPAEGSGRVVVRDDQQARQPANDNWMRRAGRAVAATFSWWKAA